MAKPKRSVVIKKLYMIGALFIFCDQHMGQAVEVKSIEGISAVTIREDMLWAWVDPRYDVDEVAAEVETMLTPVEIPEAFYD